MPAAPEPRSEPPSLELTQLQEAWQRTIVPAVEERSIPAASVLREAHPSDLADDTLTVEFPASAAFHRQLAEEPKNATLLADALYEVTGRRLGVAFAEGEAHDSVAEDDEPPGEEHILELVKETFDAREREDWHRWPEWTWRSSCSRSARCRSRCSRRRTSWRRRRSRRPPAAGW
jgi:hypothetical protein